MDQYKKSGPPQSQREKSQVDVSRDRLEHLVKEQGDHIKRLDKEITRLKTKLDTHADFINQNKRG